MPKTIDNSKIIKSYAVLISLILIAAGLLGAAYTGEGWNIFSDLLRFMLSPSIMRYTPIAGRKPTVSEMERTASFRSV